MKPNSWFGLFLHLFSRISLLSLLSLSLAILVACSQHPELKPFKSDGCSLFPDRDKQRGDSWCQCCVVHDFAYWKGGADSARLAADKALKTCILNLTRDTNLADLVYSGVRAGGSGHFPTWYRWGYGWPYKMKSLPDSLKIKKIEEKGNFDQAAILKAACHD